MQLFEYRNENLSKHCTMHVGGNCERYIEPKNIEQFMQCIKNCETNKLQFFILGNGSNVIFGDKGYKGTIICTKLLNNIAVKKDIVCCESGVNLYVLNKFLIEHNLSGMEFSYGIPGTIGGAVCMNAGAYGNEMKDVVLKAKIYDGKKVHILYNNELEFGYRDSIVKQKKFIILKVWLKLKYEDKNIIQQRCDINLNKRKCTQPLEYFNSGSIFKSKQIYAGKIIDNLGLKGLKINGAQISTLHANFIINLGNAKCSDVIQLIKIIKQEVKQNTGIDLEEEVIFIGEN